MANEPDSGYQRLDNQISWYDGKSISNQRWFKCLKLIEIVAAAGIPVAVSYNSIVTAVLGVLVVVLEGAQYLNQFHHNWITYRSTCEVLRHEKYLFLAGAGPYEEVKADAAKKLLARRVESLISTEHTRWFSIQERVRKQADKDLN